jgi:hypothetical protein
VGTEKTHIIRIAHFLPAFEVHAKKRKLRGPGPTPAFLPASSRTSQEGQPAAGTPASESWGGLGLSLEPVLANRKQSLTLLPCPHPCPRATMLAFVGKYCVSRLSSTEEAFVRKRV